MRQLYRRLRGSGAPDRRAAAEPARAVRRDACFRSTIFCVNPAALIDASALSSRLETTGCVVVDCRFELTQPHRGFARYLEGHVPGARYAHLDKDLAGPVTASTGRHPLPAPAAFTAALACWGIDRGVYVVAYDDAGGAIAARLWWMLRWIGHDAAAVLDGGLRAWQAAGLPLEKRMSRWRPAAYDPAEADGSAVATTADVMQLTEGTLLDARAPARFRGEHEPIDPVAGHVPGARNLPFTALLDEAQQFLRRADLVRVFAAHGVDERSHAVVMCGSGVTACHLLLGLEAAGLPRGRLYAGSWSEWVRDASRPIANGSAPG